MKSNSKSVNLNKNLFKHFASKWLKEITSEIKSSSLVKYTNVVELYLLPRFGRTRINQIDRSRVNDFSQSLLANGGMKKQGLMPATVNSVLTVLKRILDYASQETGCPTINFRKLRVGVKKPAIAVLTRSEQKKLWRYLRAHLSPCNLGILLCLTYGLRIGEICALRWGDIQLNEGVLSINRALGRHQTFAKNGTKTKLVVTSLKSAYSERSIPLAPCDFELLERQRLQDNIYILTGCSDKLMEPRTLRNHFKKTLRACNIRAINFHALRHSFATRWIELGYDVKTLSEILGHSSVNVTLNYYVHPSIESKRQSISNFSRNVFLTSN